MQRMNVVENQALQDAGVGVRCRGALESLLDRLRELRIDSRGADDLAWYVGVLVHTMREVVRALEGVCRFLDSRAEPVRRLPPEDERRTLLSLSNELMGTATQMVGEMLDVGLETAWLTPDVLPPLSLAGCGTARPGGQTGSGTMDVIEGTSGMGVTSASSTTAPTTTEGSLLVETASSTMGPLTTMSTTSSGVETMDTSRTTTLEECFKP